MKIIHGKILEKEIEGEEIPKTILTIDLGGDEKCFIEVRSKFLRECADRMSEGDNVEIVVTYEGKKSNKGFRFNNMVAKNIKTINN